MILEKKKGSNYEKRVLHDSREGQMVPVLVLANNFIKESKEGAMKYLTPMKLQKLLYFTYGRYAAKTGRPLFAENFQAWQYGPVLSSVYQEFKCFGSDQINTMSTDASGNSYIMNWNAEENAELRDVFYGVCKDYKNDNAVELSKKTHKEGTPWAETYANGIIEFSKICEYFKGKDE